MTARDHETLITRSREGNDGATPAGVSLLALALPRLAALTGDAALYAEVEGILRVYRDRIERFPAAFGAMLCAVDQILARRQEIVLAGPVEDPALRPFHEMLRTTWLPHAVIASVSDAAQAAKVPLLAGKTPVDGRPAAYLCEGGACKPPVTSADDLRRLIAGEKA
jgi:uncharacterized protein YyaL (SSP411 family)